MSATVLPMAVQCSRCPRVIRYDLWQERFDCVFCGRRGLCDQCVGACCASVRVPIEWRGVSE